MYSAVGLEKITPYQKKIFKHIFNYYLLVYPGLELFQTGRKGYDLI